jgi:hypothetical protein
MLAGGIALALLPAIVGCNVYAYLLGDHLRWQMDGGTEGIEVVDGLPVADGACHETLLG